MADSVNEHAAAGCSTVNVCPAMVMVPDRAPPVFAAALNPIDPLPLPEAADVIVNHAAFDVAVHAHPFAAVIVTVPVPPLAGID